MKRSLLPLLLVIAPLATPLAAQKMGSANANAPKVTQQVVFKGGDKISVTYTASTVAAGRTLGRLMDKKNGGRTRTFFNQMADQSPLGELSTTSEITIGGKTIAKGEHSLAFKIDEDLNWSLNVTAKEGGETITVPMSTSNGDKPANRLQLTLHPGATPAESSLSIAFATLRAKFSMGAQKAAGSRPTSRASK